MNILVLLKQTFDTEEQVNIKNDEILEEEVQFIVNPYDEYAIEEAVSLKEEQGGEVEVLSVGPPRAEEALRTALAMGADKAVLIEQEDLPTDERVIAKVISAYIHQDEHDYDLILGGYMSVDNGSAQVGPRVAENLGLTHVSTAVNLEIQDGTATVERDVEGSIEYIAVDLPVLITAQQDLNEPRYPTLPAIMKAKRKPLKRLTVDDLDIAGDELYSQLRFSSYSLPPERKAGIILEGNAEEQSQELARILVNHKVI